jgi:hypothetical protein
MISRYHVGVLTLLIALAVGCPADTVPPASPTSAPKLDQPKAGTAVVSGHSSETNWPVRVKLFDAAGNMVQQRDVLVAASDSSIVAGFTVNLQAGQIVQAYLLNNGAEVMPSAPVSVAAEKQSTGSLSAPQPAPTRVPAKILGDLAPGQTSVYVTATPTLPKSGYEVQLYPYADGIPASILDSGSVKRYAVTDQTGQALVTLNAPLVAGQSLSFGQKIVDTTNPNAAPTDGPGSSSSPVIDPSDLGRVRYYFTSGVVLSNNQGFQLPSSSTQAGLFLGLNADRAWAPLNDAGFRRWNVNTYLDARLTSVATQQQATTGSSLTQSQKAAAFQAGIYVPFVVANTWRNGSNRYSLFLGPFANAGFVTLTDQQPTTSVATPVTDSFFKSYSYGTRLGVFQHFSSADAAPQIVSYVDMTVGRYGDFEAFRAIAPLEFLSVRPWRYSFEGMLKLPQSPFVIGFDANIGMGALRGFTQPSDDLRFLIGAEFDFSKFLKSLQSF